MSGICGVWQKQNPGRAKAVLDRMLDGLLREGTCRPEQRSAAGAGVGVQARFHTQQIFETPAVLIACDAELRNRKELIALAANHPAAQHNTAALLAVLYERFGCDFAAKLRGVFSIILWDRKERKLVAAVDHFGVNRLVYYEDSQVALVATRIESLRCADAFDLEVNPRAVANVLNFSVNFGPETAVCKVMRIPPATVWVASESGTVQKKYWDMRYGVGDEKDETRLSQQLHDVVERSVSTYCQSNGVGLGAFLSGGTDSSTIVGMMARIGPGKPQAFSIGFEEESFNELAYATIAARKFGAEHYTQLVGPRQCVDVIPEVVRFFDEPFGNSSAIATYFCARLAADHGIRTMLGGDGGDELFGGNSWYATDRIFAAYGHLPHWLRSTVLEPLLDVFPLETGLIGKARRYVRRAKLSMLERVMSYHFLCAHPLSEIFDAGFLHQLRDYPLLEIPAQYFQNAPAQDPLDRLLYVDLKTIIGDSDLPKVTCMCEMAGIQARFPFLEVEVAEFSGRIPASLKVKGTQKRYLFKRAFRDLLPEEILFKKKHGFGIPVSTWLKSDQRLREFSRDVLFSSRSRNRGYFRPGFLEWLIARHEADSSSYYGDILWSVFALELWHRQFVDQPAGVSAT